MRQMHHTRPQAMAEAALEVFHDSNRAIADKLSSQDGASSWANRGDRHKAIGAPSPRPHEHGCVKYVMRARGISVEAASESRSDAQRRL